MTQTARIDDLILLRMIPLNRIKMTWLIACLILSGAGRLLFAQEQHPNIVFILADDLGFADVGFNGSTFYETPNLDTLAASSMNFKRAYMYPTCSPSRAALLTGKHSFRTQVYTVPVLEQNDAKNGIFSRWTVELEHKFYSQPLNEAGYKLIHLGKWHVVGPYPEREKNYPFKGRLGQPEPGDTTWVAQHKKRYQAYYPLGKGFHENVGGTWWGDPARGYKEGYKSRSGGYLAPFRNPFIEGKIKDGTWLTDYLTDQAIRFIGEHKQEPFFVNLHFHSPHRPTVARSEELLQKYRNKAVDPATGQGPESTAEAAGYATMIENIDENVGRLLAYLDAQGLRENTVVIFASDNGFNTYQSVNTGLRGGKGYVYEGGIRVPMLVNWPGKIQPGVTDQYIHGIDMFPTFLDLAGIRDSYKGILDGTSILPALEGKADKERAHYMHVASAYKNPACTVMHKGDWKLIEFLVSKETELYNLKDDPRESRNLSSSNPEKLNEMRREMHAWRKAHNVPIPPAATKW